MPTSNESGQSTPSSIGVMALNPLVIPVMDYGSVRPGLGYDDLNDPTRPVQLQAFLNPQGYRPGNFVTLYWDNVAVQAYVLEESHIENAVMGFSVFPASIKEPEAETYYTVFDFLSNSTSESDHRIIRIKMSPPGGLDTDTSTPWMNDRLALAVISPASEINDPNTPVTVSVSPWINMAEDDELTVMWNGVRLKQPPLPANQVGKTQTIVISKETLIEGGDGESVIVNYEIRDIVNNYSLVSRPATVKVIVDPNAPNPPRVRVRGATVTVIDVASLGSENVQVEIPGANLLPNDLITLTWLGRTADGTEKRITLGPTPVPGGGFNLEFTLSNADILAIAGGGAIVSYEVKPLNGPIKNSRSTTITVTGDPVKLTAPSIDEARGLVIDPVDVITTATVRIKPYNGKAFGDVIYLLWEGVTQTGTPLVYDDNYSVGRGEGALDTLFRVNKNNIDALANGSLTLGYWVISAVSGENLASETASYTVSGSILLPMPTVDNAPGDVFDPGKYPAGTSVRIDGQAIALKRREKVTTYWTGATQEGSASREFLVASDNQQISWAIPPEIVKPSAGKTVDVLYEVTRLTGVIARSFTRTLSIEGSAASVITDDFSTKKGALIRHGQSVSTQYTTIHFISGPGQMGFPIRDAVPPDALPAMAIPVLHVCYQHPAVNPGTQTILIELNRACSMVECDVHGCNGGITVSMLGANQNVIDQKVLPSQAFQHFSYSHPTQSIHFIRIVGIQDWTLWDNLKMTF